MAKKKVFVGLSGGVDSSVTALRLMHEGYGVVGVFIKVWQPEFLSCNWEQERLDAMRVAAHLGIPFLTLDAADAYKREVGEYFIREYQAGRTPNPDVMCNKFVKFGAFLEFAKANGADFVATGHYAQVREQNGLFALYRGVDEGKDQSYFLWTLTQEQLKHVLLPVGRSTKDQIRNEAARAGIPTATKKDSQGICFLGHVDIAEFMGHFVEFEKGDVLDEVGNVIGAHQGALIYTLGQRHGFTVTSDPKGSCGHYVVAKNVEQNTITVANEPPQLAHDHEVTLTEMNWIVGEAVTRMGVQAQFRYRQRPVQVTVVDVGEGVCVLRLGESVEAPAAGQSCVLYVGGKCLGGGVVR